MEQNFDIQGHQKLAALRRKEVQYRKSIEFIYKDKRLRNAIPPMESANGDVKRFVSANPKLAKILQQKEKKRNNQAAKNPLGSDDDFQSNKLGVKKEEPSLVSKMVQHARAKKSKNDLEQNQNSPTR